MTISAQYAVEAFLPASSPYTFNFEFLEEDDIALLATSDEGVVTVIDPSQYLTVGNARVDRKFQGGTVTVTGSEPLNTSVISVARVTDMDQLIDYTDYGPFPSATTEFTIDKLTMLVQEMSEQIATGLNPSGGGAPVSGPAAGVYVPLGGTTPTEPLTAAIEWGAPTASGRYRLNHGPSFGSTNFFGILTDSQDSTVAIQARDTTANGAQVRNFYFNPDGGLLLPATAVDESWSIGFADYLGVEVLSIGPIDNVGGIDSRGTVIFTEATTGFLFQPDGQLVLPRQPTGGDDDLMAATKKYVDDTVGGGAGESNTASNQGGGIELAILPKVGVDLPFRTLNAVDANITITLNGNLVDVAMASTLALTSIGLTGGIISETGVFNTSLAVTVAPALGTEVVNLDYFNANTDFVDKTTAQTINGIKTFNESIDAIGGIGWTAGAIGSSLTLNTTLHSTGEPTTDFVTSGGDVDTLVRKDYVDVGTGLLAAVDATKVDKTITVTGGTGLSGGGALSSNQVISVDSSVVRENIANTFTVIPKHNIPITTSTQMVTRAYVDLAVSDERLKENIVDADCDKAIQMLETYRVREFDWKDDQTIGHAGHDFGFIAQEVEEHSPHMVGEMAGTKAIAKNRLIGVLWAQNKGQQDKINELETRLARLESLVGGV